MTNQTQSVLSDVNKKGADELSAISPVSGAIGTLSTRLAERKSELEALQNLRYRVFSHELHGTANSANGLDRDAFDQVCDHLIVTDRHDPTQPEHIVGTYRLLLQSVAERNLGFYSSSEFDIASLVARHPEKRFLELGRSCVSPGYRNKRTIELLWHGTWSYILHHEVDVLFGCASFPGTNPEIHQQALSYLFHNHLAKDAWHTVAQGTAGIRMDFIPSDQIDIKAALKSLPPLIKGYLRLGAKVASHAVVDEAFGTTDVLIILPVADINPKYVSYYGENAQRHRAA